ncbi:DUF5937 family protein [Actinomycetota bacterium]|nr:helix-turn-helix domain-containing protein [Micrococcales bacterium]
MTDATGHALRYELSEADLADIRFAISPLSELGLSLRALRAPDRFPMQLGWIRRTEAERAQLDLEGLLALVDHRMWTPDFLTPRPLSPLRRLEDELAELEAMPVAEFRRQVLAAHGRLPAAYAGPGRAPMRRMVTALRDYWQACFEPYWPRMRTVLDADIVYRGRVLAQQGTAAMFADLSPNVTLSGSLLEVRLKSELDRTDAVGGSGLVLVPTLFTRRASVPVLPDVGPSIMYAARGQGAMWAPEEVAGADEVAALIGRARTNLLLMLEEPLSTTVLGLRLGVTPSAVSQHLQALRRGGLVAATRHGRSVLYLRTDLADRLLGAG